MRSLFPWGSMPTDRFKETRLLEEDQEVVLGSCESVNTNSVSHSPGWKRSGQPPRSHSPSRERELWALAWARRCSGARARARAGAGGRGRGRGPLRARRIWGARLCPQASTREGGKRAIVVGMEGRTGTDQVWRICSHYFYFN